MKKHRLFASVLSVVLAASAAMTCYASTENYSDGEAHIVEGDVVNTDSSQPAVSADNSGTSVTVNGSVESESGGVSASAGGAVSVSGSVEAYGVAVNVSNNSNVTIGGNVNNTSSGGGGVSAYGGSTVNITGDLSVAGDGGIYTDNSTVTVGGSLQSASDGVMAFEDSNISIGGNVTSGGGPVLADGNSTVTVGGDVNRTREPSSEYTSAVDARNGSNVNVTGSVTAPEAGGINAENGSTVTVGGNVEGIMFTAVNAESGSTVTVGGNVSNTEAIDAVCAENGSTVTVGGDVTSSVCAGVRAETSSTVTVGGNVEGGGMYGLTAEGGSTVTVEGNAKGGDAVNLEGGSKVTVKGDVSGDRYGITIEESQDSSSGAAVVLGTVTAGADSDSYCINVSSDALTKEDVLQELPTIIVGELSSANEQFVNYTDNSGKGTLDTEAVAQAIAEQILYYIDVQDTENGSIKIDSGTTKVEGYDVAHANDTVTVTVTADKGYEIQTVNGGKATAVKNEDGSWSITVPKTGGVSISAIMAAIKKVEDDTSDSDGSSSSGSSSSSSDGSNSSGSSSSGSSQSGIPDTEGTWKQDAEGNWFMQNPAGATYKDIWIRSNGSWYYAGSNGIITTGWLKIGNYWYYFDNSGKMLTGWQEINGVKYHLNDSLASMPIGAWIEE